MTRFLQKLAFTFVVSGLLATTAFSQNNIKSQILDDNGAPRFIQLENAVDFNGKSSDLLKESLNLGQNEAYVLNSTEKDKLGQSHYRYQQYYKGVKVEHGTYLVHTKGDKAMSLNGDYKKIAKDFNVNPTLTEAQALQKALDFVGAEKYMWEDAANEEFAKQTEPSKTFMPKGELVIVENNLSESKSVRSQLNLAYKFNIYAAEPMSRAFVYVNAITGDVVMKDDIIKTLAASGPADTRYSGPRTINTDSYNGSYRLRDYTRGNGIIIWDMNTSTNYSSAVDFTDLDNNWTTAEFEANKDNIGMEASWAFNIIYDYWMNVHGRNSFDNQGGLMNVYVHYDVAYDNAYWNGSVFTFGDGSDTYFDALASLDVSGHEHGHGLCTYTANLTYSYESGALNEAFSDIWGACLEAYAAPEKMVWVMGEDIERRDGHIGLRILSDPNAEGLPDTYLGDYWYTRGTDNGGVHYNNGPFCYWFYLISEGGSGVNDNGDAYSVTGIGIEKAEQIAYRTESVYMTSSSNYAAARTLTIQSAIDLYGAGSNEVIQVTNAMYAIGVGEPYDGTVVTDTEAPTAPASLTSSNVTSSSVDLSWNASTDNVGVTGYDVYKNGSYLATTTSTNYAVTGLTAATTYSFYIKAKDAAANVSSASNTINVTTNEIVVGEDQPMVSTIALTVTRSGRKYYGKSTINVSSNGTPVSNAYVQITWSGAYNGTSSGYTDALGNYSATVSVTSTSLTVTINDITATGYYWDIANSQVTKSYSSFADKASIEVSTYPNPCASEVNFIVEQDYTSNATINLFDMTGKQVVNKEVEIIQGFNTIQLDVQSLEKGMYIYRISTNDGTTEGKIVKK